jgi:hypothetical protein
MFKFLFLLFGFFLLLVLLLGFSVIRTFKRILFGAPKTETGRRHTNPTAGQQQTCGRICRSQEKLFTKDDGEYVDYEEVKE